MQAEAEVMLARQDRGGGEQESDGESEAAKVKRNATDDLKVTTARGTVTTDDLPKNTPPVSAPPTAKDDDAGSKRGKRERE